MSYILNTYSLLGSAIAVDLTLTGDTAISVTNAKKYIVKEVIAKGRTVLDTQAGEGFLQIYLGANQTGSIACNSFDFSLASYPTNESYITADITYPTYAFGNVVMEQQELYLNHAGASAVPLTVDILIYGIILE